MYPPSNLRNEKINKDLEASPINYILLPILSEVTTILNFVIIIPFFPTGYSVLFCCRAGV
jgi:hypothetical protein